MATGPLKRPLSPSTAELKTPHITVLVLKPCLSSALIPVVLLLKRRSAGRRNSGRETWPSTRRSFKRRLVSHVSAKLSSAGTFFAFNSPTYVLSFDIFVFEDYLFMLNLVLWPSFLEAEKCEKWRAQAERSEGYVQRR